MVPGWPGGFRIDSRPGAGIFSEKEPKGKNKGKGARGMEEEADKVAQLLHGDWKVDRQLERLDDVETLTRIIHHYREKRARSSEIAIAIVKFIKEG